MKPEYKIQNIEAVSEHRLLILNEVLNKKYGSKNLKINAIRKTFNCVCAHCRSETFNFPARRVIFQLDGIQRIETYCLKCFHKAGYSDTTTNKPKKRNKK